LYSLREIIKDFISYLSETIGIHPIDLIAIILLPMLFFSLKKYTKEDVEITLTDKLFDIPFFIGAFIIYIFFLLNLYGVLRYN
jgi:hypothetical protein|tara:strand:+ start:180 stop:428 length:249 start_codon:yes stop_codon:yes gene_type:complete